MTQLTRLETPAESLSSSTMSSGGAEAVKVIVRCRPLSDQEINAGHQKILSIDTKRGVIEIRNPKEPQNPPKVFTFDAVYDENSKQMDLYYEVFRDLVDSVLKGFNGTIFAYGQTGTGKTFTMEGIRDNSELRGVIPNAIDHIFRHISQSTNQQYLVRASYLEIYQEEIRDLLNTKDKDKRLELKERPDIGVYVKDLNSFVTKSMDDIMQVMKIGNENRSVGRTNMNEHSSRSHAIFMITIECSEPGLDGENHIRVGRLNLVDLAGSERQSKTGAQGERFKEATKINLSLSALGNVISALVDGKSSHIPYRDSKLTRLLQDSLGGNSKTVMVANIGPASYNLEETLSTLRYANRAKNIKNKPRINEDPKDALLREFQDEIARLKEMLKKRTTSGNRKRRRRQEGMNDSSEYHEETSVEEYLKEQQKKLDEERASLEQNKELREEEKLRLMESLEDRQKQLIREREAQKLVAEKILNMQSKLLSGTGNLLDQTKEQQRLLQERRIELAEQKRREREILQQLEAQEDNTAEIHQTFANLQQEVEVKTKKLQKLFAKLQQVRMEIQDNADAYSKERQQLEQSITEINKELKLKWLIVENFIPAALVDKLRERAVFDEDQGTWKVLKPGERPGSGDYVPLEKVEHKIMVDSGLGPGISDVSSSTEDGFKLMPIKRPISMMGLRRPTTNFERDTMAHLRQRMRSPRTIHAFSNDYMTLGNRLTAENAFASDNILRFCGENVITFGNLELYPSKVVDYQSDTVGGSRKSSATAKESERKASQNVVIEVTKIPPPRSASRDARAGSNIRRLSAASTSKNARARSAHGRAIASPVSPGGSQGSASSADRNTPTLVFPKARALKSSLTHSLTSIDEKNNNYQTVQIPLLTLEDLDGKKQSFCQSPKSVSTSSSSSKDLGFGDEVPDDPEPGDFLQELEPALELDFNFNYEKINMGLCCGKSKKPEINIVEGDEYSCRSPTKVRFENSKKKTRIPVPKLMSQSVITPRSILKTSQTDVLSRSYHDGAFSTVPTFYYPVQRSQEQLVERERSVLQESQKILARVRERKPVETITTYPERAVTFPIHRPVRPVSDSFIKSSDSSIKASIRTPELLTSNILTPEHEVILQPSLLDDLPPQMKLIHIDSCVHKIFEACEELKNLDHQLLARTGTRESNLIRRHKIRNPLGRNPDLNRHQNNFGGKIIPVERQLALYRNHKGRCSCCRWESLLHRVHEKTCPLNSKKRSKIGKRNVIRRHPCLCDIFHSDDKANDEGYSKELHTFVDFPPFTYMIYFGLLAIIFQIIQLMS